MGLIAINILIFYFLALYYCFFIYVPFVLSTFERLQLAAYVITTAHYFLYFLGKAR